MRRNTTCNSAIAAALAAFLLLGLSACATGGELRPRRGTELGVWHAEGTRYVAREFALPIDVADIALEPVALVIRDSDGQLFRTRVGSAPHSPPLLLWVRGRNAWPLGGSAGPALSEVASQMRWRAARPERADTLSELFAQLLDPNGAERIVFVRSGGAVGLTESAAQLVMTRWSESASSKRPMPRVERDSTGRLWTRTLTLSSARGAESSWDLHVYVFLFDVDGRLVWWTRDTETAVLTERISR